MPALIIDPTPGLRLCTTCRTERPIEDFRRDKRGSTLRARVCRSCHNRYESRRIAIIRADRRRRELMAKLTEMDGAEGRKQFRDLTMKLLDEFGGAEAVAGLFADTYDRAKKGTFTRYRCLRAIMRMMEEVRVQDAEDRPSYGEMSDEELSAGLKGHVQSYIQENPGAAVLAAADLGWTVIPPADDENLTDWNP